MRVAGLKAISTVVESTAVLVKSKHPSDQKLIDLITGRIRGVITAQKYVLCTYNIPRGKLEEAKSITPGKRAPTVTSLQEDDWVAINVMVESKQISDVMDRLEAMGAEDILVTKLENTQPKSLVRHTLQHAAFRLNFLIFDVHANHRKCSVRKKVDAQTTTADFPGNYPAND